MRQAEGCLGPPTPIRAKIREGEPLVVEFLVVVVLEARTHQTNPRLGPHFSAIPATRTPLAHHRFLALPQPTPTQLPLLVPRFLEILQVPTLPTPVATPRFLATRNRIRMPQATCSVMLRSSRRIIPLHCLAEGTLPQIPGRLLVCLEAQPTTLPEVAYLDRTRTPSSSSSNRNNSNNNRSLQEEESSETRKQEERTSLAPDLQGLAFLDRQPMRARIRTLFSDNSSSSNHSNSNRNRSNLRYLAPQTSSVVTKAHSGLPLSPLVISTHQHWRRPIIYWPRGLGLADRRNLPILKLSLWNSPKVLKASIMHGIPLRRTVDSRSDSARELRFYCNYSSLLISTTFTTLLIQNK